VSTLMVSASFGLVSCMFSINVKGYIVRHKQNKSYFEFST
jgi:hypothetical protein